VLNSLDRTSVKIAWFLPNHALANVSVSYPAVMLTLFT